MKWMRKRMEKWPPLVALLAVNAAQGFAAAFVFIGAILAFDIGGMGHLVFHSPDGWIAGFALTFATGLTFGSVQMGIAVMLLEEREEKDNRPGPRVPLLYRLRLFLRRTFRRWPPRHWRSLAALRNHA
ncbi:hypothetical protein [Zavarzinia sp.]|uniref:hypothetical protein n=1 Tax=Zavarzinia sp. TaxID=2027920 RepID=UPI0035672011